MKAINAKIYFALLWVLALAISYGQSEKRDGLPFTQSKSGSKITYSPEKPMIGDSISIKFIPGRLSPLIKADSVYLNMLYLYTSGGYKADEYLMKKIGDSWVTKFKMVDDKAGCIALQFASPDFDNVDCNDEQGWDILIYDKTYEPVKGAFKAYSDGYMTHGLIRRMQDMDKYKNGLEEEYRRYPDDPINLLNVIQYRPKAEVKRVLDSLTTKYSENKDVLKSAAYSYISIKDTVSASKLNKRVLELNPDDATEIWNRRNSVFFKSAGPEKLVELAELERLSEGKPVHATIQRDYFQTLIGAKLYSKAIDFIPRWKKPDLEEIILLPARMIVDCNQILKKKSIGELASYIPLSEDQDKINEIVKNAFDITKLGIDLYNKKDVSSRRSDYTPSIWLNNRQRMIGLSIYYLGQASILAKKDSLALKFFDEAKTILKNTFYSMLDENYFELLSRLKKTKRAFQEAETALENNPYNAGLLVKIISALAVTPTEKNDAQNIIVKNKELIKKVRTKEINSNFFKNPVDAKDFILSDLDGKKWHLSELKGKVVILEFWDTYCGWCLKSLEVLTKFYVKHKNDKDIVFLTINTNPGENDRLKYDNVLSFVKEHKYPFPVLLDYQNKVVLDYKLYGVPQTLVIGKEGKVHYKETGYGGDSINIDLETVIEKIK